MGREPQSMVIRFRRLPTAAATAMRLEEPSPGKCPIGSRVTENPDGITKVIRIVRLAILGYTTIAA